MPIDVLAKHSMPIKQESDIIEVRRKARAVAVARGFDGFASAAITTAVSELARNVWVHGGGGEATIEELTDGLRFGLRVVFRDDGPGIPDVDRVLAGGYSTARSLGLGVSGTKRLVDDFHLETVVGKGTRVTITKWKRF